MKPRTPAEVPVEKDLGYASLSTPSASSDGPTASSLSPPPTAVDLARVASLPPPEGSGRSRSTSTYITVLLDNHDSAGRPDGTRKQVEVKLIRRNPSTVVVELPDGRMVKRKIQRDVVGGL